MQIEDIFSANYDMYQALVDRDITKLKAFGKVIENVVKVNGVETTTYTFIAPDGKQFIFASSSFTDNIKYKTVQELNDKIAEAVSIEDYLLAAKLKKEKELLLTQSN